MHRTIMCIFPFLLLTAVSAAASSQDETWESMAILQPVFNTNQQPGSTEQTTGVAAYNIGGAVIAGASSATSPGTVSAPDENASRVIPMLIKDAVRWKWLLPIHDYQSTISAQEAVLGSVNTGQKTMGLRQLADLSAKLNVRYLVVYVVQELQGYVTTGIPVRTTGRCRLDLLVYDGASREFVWQANAIDTSTASGKSARSKRIDQSLFNALRKALDPFAKGERKKIQSAPTGLLVTVKQVSADGKTIALEPVSSADIRAGDVFYSLDGSSRLRVTQLLQNGCIAELLQGKVTAGDVVRSD